MVNISLLKVDGHSMHPAIKSGVFVLVWRWQIRQYQQRLQVGDIIAVEHAHYGKIIKRICEVDLDSNGQVSGLRLRGDNELASISEAKIGWVSVESVIGRVVYVIKARP